MIAEEIKILIAIINLCKNGRERVDVFDVIYETCLRYPQIKPHLDGLVSAGEISALDTRYYVLCGSAEEKLKELTEKYPRDVTIAQLKPDGQSGNEHAKEEEDAAAVERKRAFETRREEFLHRLRERREEIEAEAAKRAEEEDDEDDEDDDIDYEEIRRIIDAETEDDEEEKGSEESDVFYSDNKDKFSKELKKIIREAFDFALCRHTSYVGSGHLVYAMLFNECKAYEILSECGASRVFYGYSLREVFGNSSDKAYHTGLNEEGRSMLARAYEIAVETEGSGTRANTVHLLKAVLEDPYCMAVQCLASARTEMEKLDEEIRKYLNGEND